MIAVLQRVSSARVLVDDAPIGSIQKGILVFAAALRGDAEKDADALAGRIVEYRIFPDAAGKMNCSVLEAGGAILVVSQFTLAADGEKGRRPSFDRAAPPDDGRALFDRLVLTLRSYRASVETGRFGAEMRVEIVNEGPATFVLERPSSRMKST
ncbi:MAG: D-tyrosyl-tRNA(Tyr) deacylase [Planctomycetes bacterium]|nr:D-tyrosyl-tRNA(Tyr) deacylase [Planctomycetota bacterium]